MPGQDKLEKLEEKFFKVELQVSRLDWEIKWKLDSIEKLLLDRQSDWTNLTTQIEKQKVNERRFDKIDDKIDKMQLAINWINLKIAMVSWAWTVVLFLISKLT